VVEYTHKFLLRFKEGLQILKSASRKCFGVAILSLITLKATSPGSTVESLFLPEPARSPIPAFESLMNAIIMVESSGDTMAFNPDEEAYGAFQIRPVRVRDYNKRTGKNYKEEDCFSFSISREIFLYYAENMNYPDDESIARNWNGSGPMTIVYWGKVNELLTKERIIFREKYSLEKIQSIHFVSIRTWSSD